MNLDRITPPSMKFKILSGADREMHDGQILEYRIRLAPGLWTSWVTEIKSVTPLGGFVDEQRFGPYKFWHHRHSFTKVSEGVKIEDEVHYGLGFGAFGRLAHALYVRRELEQVFDYRHSSLNRLFR
jgi:ligand-binding SRPBCC domain-containing protein